MDWRVLVLITVVFWGSYAVILRAVAGRLDPMVSMLWFIVGYAASIALYLVATMGKSWAKTFEPAWVWALVAGVVCAVGAITFFRALPLAKGSVVVPLVGLGSVVTAIGCIIFLKEEVTPRLIVGLFCAGAAVVLLGK